MSDLRERAADFLWPRYYASEEDNTTTREDFIANDGTCEALAMVFAAIRAEAKAEGWEDAIALLLAKGEGVAASRLARHRP